MSRKIFLIFSDTPKMIYSASSTCSHDNLFTHYNHFVIICDCELYSTSVTWLARRLCRQVAKEKAGWWDGHVQQVWWWWYISYDKVYVFACLSVTSLLRIVSRLGLRCVPRLFKKNIDKSVYLPFLQSKSIKVTKIEHYLKKVSWGPMWVAKDEHSTFSSKEIQKQ